MSLAVLFSRALQGGDAPPVRVETFVGGGLPSFQVVGLADTEVRESRDRVRAAIHSSGFDFPAGRVVVSLAPADLPKESGRFDLPIALGVLLASGQIRSRGVQGASAEARVMHTSMGDAAAPERSLQGLPREDTSGEVIALSRTVFAGELSLTGVLVPVHAPLSLALGVRADLRGATLVLPHQSAQIASCVPDITVKAARTLGEVVAHLENQATLPTLHTSLAIDESCGPCLSDVRGQPSACQALCLAAAGGHSLLMQGWPGVGKSMLAQRLTGLLPALSPLASLQIQARFECANLTPPPAGRPPFRAPHHSISAPALIGGGVRPQPGEISLAHHGVLFLDELPEFKRAALESLREPLETGWVAVSRLAGRCSFPARCQLIAAMNPCPCGWHGHPRRSCICSAHAIARYRSRLSGPLLDRIDLQVVLHSGGANDMSAPPGPLSLAVRMRVEAARRLQRERQDCLNSELEGIQVERLPIEADARRLLSATARQGDWSARALHRVWRVAQTCADLGQRERIAHSDVAQAVHLRQDLAR